MASMVKLSSRGSFKNSFAFFKKMQSKSMYDILDKYGREGVAALSAATPVDTGLTAASWGYEIEINDKMAKISWWNSNTNKGTPIALLIQYGHATGNGGYVEGIDYINPAMRPIFEELEKKVWKEVTK